MKKIVFALASVALVVLLSLGVSGSMPTVAQGATAKPNIVFILTDDMRKDDLKYMPKTSTILQNRGMAFENAFVSNALCCPARATVMRGQYSHNTKVWTNENSDDPGAGWHAYHDQGDEQDNVATRLQNAGYRTGLFGKYLNGYAGANNANLYIPPGWDRWFATWGDYFNYDANDDGTIKHFGTSDSDYRTDVIKRKTKEFIGDSATQGRPFFAYVAPKGPHPPATPAPRDLHTYDGLKAPRLPSFDEADVSDKPSWIRQLPRLNARAKARIDNSAENRAESLQAVDDLVEEVVGKLQNAGVMGNTYVFFTSDNGFDHGEHRITDGKARPYEEDIHMPLLVRGPGVAAGSTTHNLTLNTDYLPTFTDLACPSSNPCDTQVTQNWTYAPDGRSLRPVLEGNATAWRSAILLEGHKTPEGGGTPASYGIRTTDKKYIEYESSARELYDLKADPYELFNKYDPTAPPAALASRLAALKDCTGQTCQKAEDGP
jgi:N-acetylglucosamine-6-sulfatase